MKHRVLLAFQRLALAGPLLVALAACGESASPTPGEAVYATYENAFNQDAAERDSVLAAFATADTEPIRQAFAQLPHFAFTRYFRTEQLERMRTSSPSGNAPYATAASPERGGSR